MPKTLLEQEMPVVRLSAGAEEPLAASHETTPIAVTERREAERAISDWEEERRRLGRVLALMTLNASEMVSEKWSHRFIIAVDPTIEYCSLLFLRRKVRGPDGIAGKAQSFRPHGRAATGAICAGVHQGLHRRYASGFTSTDTGRGRSRGRAARTLPGSVHCARRHAQQTTAARVRRV